MQCCSCECLIWPSWHLSLEYAGRVLLEVAKFKSSWEGQFGVLELKELRVWIPVRNFIKPQPQGTCRCGSKQEPLQPSRPQEKHYYNAEPYQYECSSTGRGPLNRTIRCTAVIDMNTKERSVLSRQSQNPTIHVCAIAGAEDAIDALSAAAASTSSSPPIMSCLRIPSGDKHPLRTTCNYYEQDHVQSVPRARLNALNSEESMAGPVKSRRGSSNVCFGPLLARWIWVRFNSAVLPVSGVEPLG
ncbi:hypothetical protein IWZ00DRAFT_367092 [Phyllosticta capitalensis]